MRVVASVFLAVSSAFASYQVLFPTSGQNWNTTGPNYLAWERVTTDPLNFTGVLTNVNTATTQVMDTVVDGTLNIVACSPPSGGWPSGSGFQVNLAQDAQHLNNILAQSGVFNITAVSSNGSTSSASIQATISAVTTTTSSSPNTSTTPTGVSAASLGADTQARLLTAVAALTAFITALF